jgi:hypothetical protein
MERRRVSEQREDETAALRKSDPAVKQDPVTFLVQDVLDTLVEDDVGLYEFIWALRSEYPGRSLDEYREIAEAALAEIRARNDVQIVLRVWPHFEVVGYRAFDDIGPSDWEDIGEGAYPLLRLN